MLLRKFTLQVTENKSNLSYAKLTVAPNIVHSTLFSNMLSLCSSLNMRELASPTQSIRQNLAFLFKIMRRIIISTPATVNNDSLFTT
jgi:hypothetical protein